MIQQFHFLGIHPKEMKTIYWKDNCTHIYCSIIYNRQEMETTYKTISGWIAKEDVVYIYIQHISQPWEGRNPAICDNMDRPWGYYAKWDKSDRKDKYYITYMYNLKKNPQNPIS